MAVTSTKGPSHVSITFDNGVDSEGRAKKRTKSYSGVKSAATDEKIYEAAVVIVGLQSQTALEIMRKDESELREA